MRNAVRFDHIETGWIEAMEATRIYGFSKYRGAREHSIKMVVSISLSKLGITYLEYNRLPDVYNSFKRYDSYRMTHEPNSLSESVANPF